MAMYRETKALSASESYQRASEIAVGSGTLDEAPRRRITRMWERAMAGGRAIGQKLFGPRPDIGMGGSVNATPGPRKLERW